MVTEGETTKVEGATPTQIEGELPTKPKEKPTQTYKDEADFQKAVSKGLESITRQLDLQKLEAQKAQAELKSKEADLQAALGDLAELEKLNLEDPEVRDAYTSKKAFRERERAVAKAEAAIEAQRLKVELSAWKARMDTKALELSKETGIDINDFVGSQTEEEMEVRALRFKLNKAKEPPKFVTPGRGVGGESDKDFIKSFSEGKRNSPEDYERANKLLGGVIPSSAFKK